jgi:nicotinamide mononucleotide transporter
MSLWQQLEIAGAITGLVYLWLEYRASVWLWVAGIVMPVIYIYVYFHEGVYANMAINAYFVVAGLYGIVAWKRDAKKEGEKQISRAPGSVWLPSAVVGAALTAGIAWVLVRYTDSAVPWLDAFTTGFSIVGLWMLARKWAEQWLVWVVVDAVYTVMFLHQGMMPTAAMYAIFSIVAVFGFFKWRALAAST